jgi:DtxR family Mn-dependent transcriptional regulator
METATDGLVARISDQEPAILRYLEERQIAIGCRIRLEERNPAAGSVSVMRFSPAGEPAGLVEIAIGAASAVWVAFDPHRE